MASWCSLSFQRGLHALALCLLPAMAHCAPEGWLALEPAALASLRGAYTPAQDLSLTLGVEQLAAINGQLVARSRLMLTHEPSSAAAMLSSSAEAGGLLLVQNGVGNLADPALASGMTGLIIQNTLNDQAISSQTIITASVNSRALIDTINFQAQLSDALARAAAAR